MMKNLDPTTEFGQRVDRRLRQELVAWVTTVGADGTPQPSPIWFLWDGSDILIYSQPNTPKLRNIERRPNISIHLDSDGQGGNIIVITGEARIDGSTPPANEMSGYLDKYRSSIDGIGMNPESFAASYSVAIRVNPIKLRGF